MLTISLQSQLSLHTLKRLLNNMSLQPYERGALCYVLTVATGAFAFAGCSMRVLMYKWHTLQQQQKRHSSDTAA
jgi:hypothetical protein